MIGLNKQIEKETKRVKQKHLGVVLSNFWPLDANILKCWPQIRILRQKSCLEPAGNLENPESRPKNVKNDV